MLSASTLLTIIASAVALTNDEIKEKYMTSDRVDEAVDTCMEDEMCTIPIRFDMCLTYELFQIARQRDNVDIHFPESLETDAEYNCKATIEDLDICIYKYKKDKIQNNEAELIVEPRLSIFDYIQHFIKPYFGPK
ncbi:unnamed protein product [Hymenolepis diminuta]|uniref:DUF19 domain-containing protein n=1 Tax=Hymenolepis diminuta TaxID=6216 RepID=A0A564Z1Y8_HYMDI|nr:unnamed protein product [Hymenolepis diminuta]VUZ48466.1 unnamed protein product [Hymenolepis diminuta]VUZ53541.1 unnamed protein product [Hymenolepis diminuta]